MKRKEKGTAARRLQLCFRCHRTSYVLAEEDSLSLGTEQRLPVDLIAGLWFTRCLHCHAQTPATVMLPPHVAQAEGPSHLLVVAVH
jgi:hypothetical protein